MGILLSGSKSATYSHKLPSTLNSITFQSDQSDIIRAPKAFPTAMKMKLVLVILALAAPSFGGESKRNKEARYEAEMKRQAVPRRQDDVEDAVREMIAEEIEKYKAANTCNCTGELDEVTGELDTVKLQLQKYPVRIPNKGGKANATSQWNKNYRAEFAFKEVTKEGEGGYWHSQSGTRLPQKVWYKYPLPGHKVTKIGFTNCDPGSDVDRTSYAPKPFQVIGSNDCSSQDSPWTTLLDVQNAGFTNGVHERRYFAIPKANRRSFSCLGLNVLSSGQGKYTCLRNIVMFELV